MTNEEMYELKAQHKGKGIAAIVFGIISLIFCLGPISFICGIVAIILGIVAKKKSGNTKGTAGLVMGIIGSVLSLLLLLFVIGIMGPQYIKYTQKSQMAADLQICDSMETGIMTSLIECYSNFTSQDRKTIEFVTTYMDGNDHSVKLIFDSNCAFAESVKESVGIYSYNDFMDKLRTDAKDVTFSFDGNEVEIKLVGVE